MLLRVGKVGEVGLPSCAYGVGRPRYTTLIMQPWVHNYCSKFR